jgi:hypothetical protein
MRKIALLALVLVAGCSDPKEARRAAESFGFTDVRITGYRFGGCSRDDASRTGFVATNAQGREVSGVVCSSWSPFGKSSTVRID